MNLGLSTLFNEIGERKKSLAAIFVLGLFGGLAIHIGYDVYIDTNFAQIETPSASQQKISSPKLSS